MLEHMAMQLQLRHPRHKVNEHRQYSNELESKLQSCMQSILSKKKYQYNLYLEKMKGLSPLEKLSQGYSYVENKDKENIREISRVQPGEMLYIYVTDGVIEAKVTKVQEEKNV